MIPYVFGLRISMNKISLPVRFLFLSLITLIAFNACRTSPAPVVTEENYRRAESYMARNLGKRVYDLEVSPRWIEGTTDFWYRIQTRKGKEFLRVRPEAAEKAPAFDHDRLAEALSGALEKPVSAFDLPFNSITFLEKNRLLFQAENRVWTVDLESYELTSEERKNEEPALEEVSPDGKWVAFTKGYNLYVKPAGGGAPIRLSRDGKALYEYAAYLGWYDIMEGENGSRPPHLRVSWSPDSKRIFTQILDLRTARKMYLLKSVNTDYRSQLLSYYRASPGDENIAYTIPVIFDVARRREIKVDVPPVPHFAGLSARWFSHGRSLYAGLFERGYKAFRLIEIDASTGKIRTVAMDKSPTTVETQLSQFHVQERSGGALLTSERDGWNHIYLYDWSDGRLLNQVTRGEFVVRHINWVDEDRETVYFTALGREEGEDPYLAHLYSVGFDGSGLMALTPEAANHGINLSEDHSFFVDNISRVDMPTRSVLRSLESGEVVMELEQADIADLRAEGWSYPEPFSVKAADGRTDIYGLIWKPTNFDSSRTYPVIDPAYTGPQAVTAPKTFRRALMNGATALAELQFVVVVLDGRGTAMRSKAFHDFTYNNLGGGLEDHVTVLKKLAETRSWMDLDRVGIYGHSAGGYDTVRGLLQWPDFFKVGVSTSGNHDHRMAKAWWPEQYMGWPVGDFYEEQSNITNAANLKGKLLLVHGEIDDNVNPAASIRLADALIKAGKKFDMLIIPDNRHGYRGVYADYMTLRRWDYFVRHLHGLEPPDYALTREEEEDRGGRN
jgi:dipeptidyl-peptidase-4